MAFDVHGNYASIMIKRELGFLMPFSFCSVRLPTFSLSSAPPQTAQKPLEAVRQDVKNASRIRSGQPPGCLKTHLCLKPLGNTGV